MYGAKLPPLLQLVKYQKMSHNIAVAKKGQGVVYKISEHPISFAVAFLGFFTLSFIFLTAVGATPDPLPISSTTDNTQITATPQTPEAPVRLVIKELDIDTKIVTPASLDIEVMNESLTQGAMRWPTSAPLGVDGTLALFGHSSHLPVIIHQYYKLFTGIETLKPGKVISVYSDMTEYRYEVEGVSVVDSGADDINSRMVELKNDKKYLVLITCNNFGAKEKRFVVTANFIGAYTLAN